MRTTPRPRKTPYITRNTKQTNIYVMLSCDYYYYANDETNVKRGRSSVSECRDQMCPLSKRARFIFSAGARFFTPFKAIAAKSSKVKPRLSDGIQWAKIQMRNFFFLGNPFCLPAFWAFDVTLTSLTSAFQPLFSLWLFKLVAYQVKKKILIYFQMSNKEVFPNWNSFAAKLNRNIFPRKLLVFIFVPIWRKMRL